MGNKAFAAAFVKVTTGMSATPSKEVVRPVQPVAISDEALVERLRGGDASAGDELVRRHCAGLLRYLGRVSGKAALAEELHQQTWLSVLEHIDHFDTGSGAGGFRGWLYRIATNKVHDHWRSHGRRKSLLDNLSREPVAEEPEASHALAISEESAKLRRAVQQLPDAQREVVCMRYYANLKFTQIAQTLGCPLNTALGRMHKAVLKLKKLMEMEGMQ